MVERVFIDTCAFYALVVKTDAAHSQMLSALDAVQSGRVRWVTSDYIFDETATLLKVRKHPSLAVAYLERISGSRTLQVEWMDAQRFAKARGLFAKYSDQGFSFTDCFSFALMRELKIKKALTKDSHFKVMGFERLLKG
jgi:uncharacterized protein